MSGTVLRPVNAISPTGGFATGPVAAGDHLTWTLQYNTQTPANQTPVPFAVSYNPSGPVISNLVDQTNGFHFSPPPAGGLQSSLALINAPSGGGVVTAGDSVLNNTDALHSLVYQTSLSLLGPSSGFSTLDLSRFRLDQAGIQMTGPWGMVSELTYYGIPDAASGITANLSIQVTSLTPTGTLMTPEPGSLTLFGLGGLGLAARRLRSRWGRGRHTV